MTDAAKRKLADTATLNTDLQDKFIAWRSSQGLMEYSALCHLMSAWNGALNEMRDGHVDLFLSITMQSQLNSACQNGIAFSQINDIIINTCITYIA